MADKYDHIKDEKERISLIQQQQKYSFMKFFLGTFVLGVLTAGINYTLHSREIQMQKQEHQNGQVADYLGQFMHGGNKEQLAFANFMRFSAVEGEERTRYGELFFYLQTRSDSLDRAAEKNHQAELLAQATLDKMTLEKKNLQDLLSRSRGNRQVEEKLAQLKLDEIAAQLKLEKINEKEEAIAVKMSDPVSEPEGEPIIVEDVVVPVESEEFTKEGSSIGGRFMQYGQIRVLVSDPSRILGQATLKVYFVDENDKKVLIRSKRFKVGDRLVLEYTTDTHKYDLTLTLDNVSKYYRVRSKAEWTLTQKKTAN